MLEELRANQHNRTVANATMKAFSRRHDDWADMRLSFVSLSVLDQDRAKAFYTDVLGFAVDTDMPMDEQGNRWLALTAPEGTQEVTLLLEKMDDTAGEQIERRRELGIPATAFLSSDVHAECESLKAKGVTFVMEPTTQPYGGVDAVFTDSEGNLICLHQDEKA